MGASWEAMVTEEIIRGLTARGVSFEAFYYRTSGGAEVDLVLDGEFGLVPIEIKYTSNGNNPLRALQDFVAAHKCRLGLVINNDETPQLHAKNIAGVPFASI